MEKSSNLSNVFNILLIGKDDDQKLVTINAIAYFLRFYSFKKASTNDLLQTVPVNVEFYHREKFESICIPFGVRNSEESISTTALKCYLLTYGDRVIRIIDPPESEKKSYVSQIASILKQFDTINGIICLLTTQNEQIDKDFFSNNIKLFLNDLTKSAFQNIVFCFTYDHRPNYNISEFKTFIKRELESFKFELKNDDSCFHIDYEPFKFFLARKYGHSPITEEKSEEYEKRKNEMLWKIPRIIVTNMMKKILSMKAYRLNEYFFIKQREQLYSDIEKLETTWQDEIDSIAVNIKENTKRLKSSDNKGRSYEENIKIVREIKTGQIEQNFYNLNELRNWTQKYIEFIVDKSNQDPENLIPSSILNFVTLDPIEKHQDAKHKHKKNMAEIIESEKLQRYVACIKNKLDLKSNQIELSSLENSGQDFIQEFINQNLHPVKPVIDLTVQIVGVFEKCCKQIDYLTKCNQEIKDENPNKIRLVCVKYHFNGNDTLVHPLCFKECGCDPNNIELSGHSNEEKCKAVDVDSKLCQNCACLWSDHQHHSTTNFIIQNEALIKDLKNELKIINDVAPELDFLLLKHPQKSFENFVEYHLNTISIPTETPVEPDSTAEYMVNFKSNHWKCVLKHIKENGKSKVQNISDNRTKLLKLKWCGNKFTQLYKHKR